MKQILITLILVLSIFTVSATTQQHKPQWEYKFVYQCDEKKTNSAAGEGWELSDMSMAAYGSQGVAPCVFRRAK
jgi:hypothetical protein